jgi:hypothetical protein
MNRTHIYTGAALMVAATPGMAHAHLVGTGFGPFYDGIVHLFVSPEDLLPVLAMALWAGLRGPAFGRAVLLVLPVAWLAGVAAAQAAPSPAAGSVATALTTLTFGALAAVDGVVHRGVMIAAAMALGAVHGALNGAVLAQAHLGIQEAAGVAGAVLITVSLGAGVVVTLRAPWPRMAARVAGSWIAATGLLMLGWGLRA